MRTTSSCAGLITAGHTFVSAFLVALLGLLGQMAEWVDGGDPPKLTVFAERVTAAAIAAGTGLVTPIHRRFGTPPETTYARSLARNLGAAANRGPT